MTASKWKVCTGVEDRLMLLQLWARTGSAPISSRASGNVATFRLGAFRKRKCLGLSFRRLCLMSVHVQFQIYYISLIKAASGVEQALTRALNSKWTTSCLVTTPGDFFVDLVLIDWLIEYVFLPSFMSFWSCLFWQISFHFNTLLLIRGRFDCTYSLVTSGYQLQ